MPVTVKTSGNAPLDAPDTLTTAPDDDDDEDDATDPPMPPTPVGLSSTQLAALATKMIVPSQKERVREPHIILERQQFCITGASQAMCFFR